MHWLLFLTLLVSRITARSSQQVDITVKESHPVPPRWVAHGKPSPSDIIRLHIVLAPANKGAVEQHLTECSDPSHERYGRHLTVDQVHTLMRPTDESRLLVNAWLAEHGIHNDTRGSPHDWIIVQVPLSKAETMLNTTYTAYKHVEDGDVLVRAPTWSLPQHLHQHIKLIQPTTSFFRMRAQTAGRKRVEAKDTEWREAQFKQRHAQQTSSGKTLPSDHEEDSPGAVCHSSLVTPDCIRTLYKTIGYQTEAAHNNSIGISNYLDEAQNRRDLHQFLTQFRNSTVAEQAYNFSITSVHGGENHQGNLTAEQQSQGLDQEGDLDGELVLSISYPTPLRAYNTGGSPPITANRDGTHDLNEPYMDFIHYALSHNDIPLVLTSSYGDDEQTVPESYARMVCQGFAQLGARGVTVLVSSGDSGVGSQNASECVSIETGNKTFLPAFPAGCPWVTTVGTTQNFNPEVAVSQFASGGGFSTYFAAPSYQSAIVSQYLSDIHQPYEGLYNRHGRGYPDVTAQGDNIASVWNGQMYAIGGTSASAPTFATVLALVNVALLARGRPSLGFVNPWLYAGAGRAALNDVVEGSSYGCGTKGFPARKGWDAVTGWGTPDFQRLVEQAMSNRSSSSISH